MQIFFGETDITENTFVSEHDTENRYFYGVEYGSNPGGTEEVRIYDTVGRSVPIDTLNVPALIEALTLVLDLERGINGAEELSKRVRNASESVTI